MDRTGLLAKILDSERAIYQGRIWLTIDGSEKAGRISYSKGLDLALFSFKLAQKFASTDLELPILAEYTFLTHELIHSDESDIYTISSLEQAIQSFDDALLSLQVVDKSDLYQAVDKVFPHSAKYRIKDMPKDAFHIACISHRTRIGNILRAPGLNLMEKELLKLRASNLTIAQNVYLKKQQSALNKANLTKP